MNKSQTGNLNSFYQYWGKAKKDPEQKGPNYHLLPYHCLDVAAVGKILLENNVRLLERIAAVMKLPAEIALDWIIFLLGVHDIGKFAETFQQIRLALSSIFWPDDDVRLSSYHIRHDTLGMLLWKEELSPRLKRTANKSEKLFINDVMSIWLAPVFGHHGWPPSHGRDRVKNHFRDFDCQAAFDFYQVWFSLISPNTILPIDRMQDSNWRKQQKEASWLIAGLAVLCDWLGSNQDYFEFHQMDEALSLEEYWKDFALPAARVAIQDSGILPGVVATDFPPGELFPYLAEYATPLQKLCCEIEINSSPQLFILEDVTGAGKTEAALILAQRLMSAGLANGIYVGLPTMATANAMYRRMIETYRRFFTHERNPSLVLSHSARHLINEFRDSILLPHPEEESYKEEESITAQCNRWLADNRKKALLADVGVGTIDQALLGVMPARHQSLRLFGLLNKVLILDEVHAYDPYTREPLKKLLQFHASFGGSAVLLSATLTRKQREELVNAFQPGASAGLKLNDYPLMTNVGKNRQSVEQPVETRPSVARDVGVRLIDDSSRILETVRESVQAGRCVCWIRNTVSDARQAWIELAQQDWVEADKLHLFHSRFALLDRLRIEQDMLERFGKVSTAKQRSGHILVATQVVEQSLDLDFDDMISDLAPIDLLVQRAGRLHRHQREQRGKPVLVVHTPQLSDQPEPNWYKGKFAKAHFVYPHTLVLWRTARILDHCKGWKMPEDARRLLEDVYDESGDIPKGIEGTALEALGEMMGQRDAGQFASLKLEPGYGGAERWDEEAIVATRLGEDTHTVYLARWQEGKLTPWANEGDFVWDLSSLRVNKSQLSHLGEIDDIELKQSLVDLKVRVKLFDEHSIVPPVVEQHDDCWIGLGTNAKNECVEVVYNLLTGMELRYGK